MVLVVVVVVVLCCAVLSVVSFLVLSVSFVLSKEQNPFVVVG